MLRLIGSTAMLVVVTAMPALAQTANAALKSTDGKEAGNVTLTQTPTGVLLSLTVRSLPAGGQAFHVHAVGKCEAPFTSAGGHFNPANKKHGLMAVDGFHAGDTPNLHIPASGKITVEVLNAGITLEKGKPNSVFDDKGSAVVIHAGKDDYRTDPTEGTPAIASPAAWCSETVS